MVATPTRQSRTNCRSGGEYEEYHPYGSTAWHAFDSSKGVSAKRYRYTGMERDEETGLQYHSARHYAPWLGRWIGPDPIGLDDGLNRYGYAHGDPVAARDTSGLASEREWQLLREDHEVALQLISTSTRQMEMYRLLGQEPTQEQRRALQEIDRTDPSIASVSQRFSNRLIGVQGLESVSDPQQRGPRGGGRGSIEGAFKHALGGALLTARFGAERARRAGNLHEPDETIVGGVDPRGQGSERIFAELSQADSFVDLLNNELGYQVGAGGGSAKDIASRTLDLARSEGLWVVTGEPGKYRAVRRILSPEEHEVALGELAKLNESALTEQEQQEISAAFDRLNAAERRLEDSRPAGGRER